MDKSFEGKPPKSAQRIRATLQSVHQTTGTEDSAGPLANGLRPEDRIVIASFRSPQSCRRFQETLLAEGIASSKRVRGRLVQLSVDAEDRQRAVELLTDYERKYPDRRPKGIRTEFDYLIFGLLIGGTLGLASVMGQSGLARSLGAISSFTLSGALVGHLADRVKRHYRETGRMQLGLRELLILVTLPPLAFFLCRLLSLP